MNNEKIKQPNAVIAGAGIKAGLESDSLFQIDYGIVIEFPNKEELTKAIKSGKIEFTIFQ